MSNVNDSSLTSSKFEVPQPFMDIDEFYSRNIGYIAYFNEAAELIEQAGNGDMGANARLLAAESDDEDPINIALRASVMNSNWILDGAYYDPQEDFALLNSGVSLRNEELLRKIQAGISANFRESRKRLLEAIGADVELNEKFSGLLRLFEYRSV